MASQRPSSTIEPGSPTPLVPAPVHGDRLGNAKPVQHRPHLYRFGKRVDDESVVAAND